MKRILITGANSYVGTSFANYIKKNCPEDYSVDIVDMIGEGWRAKNFSGYDTVFHVAGIAHADIGSITKEQQTLYYKINTDLAVETAEKAKAEGVGQFVFMSSVLVYGNSAPIGETKVITRETVPAPANFYGDSKLKAEIGLCTLNDNSFRVVILRPPMIYGRGCRGNYPVLAKLARKLPFFPKNENERSMLYIEHLCEFVRLMIENGEQGVFWPQNREYTNTSEMVRMIAAVHGEKLLLIRGCGWMLKILRHFTGLVDKAFGSLVYEPEISEYRTDYRKYSLKESIEETER